MQKKLKKIQREKKIHDAGKHTRRQRMEQWLEGVYLNLSQAEGVQ